MLTAAYSGRLIRRDAYISFFMPVAHIKSVYYISSLTGGLLHVDIQMILLNKFISCSFLSTVYCSLIWRIKYNISKEIILIIRPSMSSYSLWNFISIVKKKSIPGAMVFLPTYEYTTNLIYLNLITHIDIIACKHQYAKYLKEFKNHRYRGRFFVPVDTY